jgi:hypothetical protein
LYKQAPEAFAMVLAGRLTISQARIAVGLKESDPKRYEQLLKAESPRQAKRILGTARQPADPVSVIKRAWARCSAAQKGQLLEWMKQTSRRREMAPRR